METIDFSSGYESRDTGVGKHNRRCTKVSSVEEIKEKRSRKEKKS